MPNWCEGTLKVRGNEANIRRFLLDGFIHEERCVKEDERKMVLVIPKYEKFYIKGTYRNFIETEKIIWSKCKSVLKIPGFMGAWHIDVDQLEQLSQEYQIDLRIFAFEYERMYSAEFEVHQGQVIKCAIINYDSYEEECWGWFDLDLGWC